ncbi:MAG: FlgO family outer membrane protein [Desulfatiglandaceae bacterium]
MFFRSTYHTCLSFTWVILLSMVFGGAQSIHAYQPNYYDANLRKATYAAADQLEDNLVHDISRVLPILSTTFVNLDRLDISSSFGRLLGEQIASRFSQHGYKVIDLKLRKNGLLVQKGNGEIALSRDMEAISASYDAQAIIAGTYVVSNNLAFISVRMVRTSDNSILTSYDFTIRLNDTLKKIAGADLSEAEPAPEQPEDTHAEEEVTSIEPPVDVDPGPFETGKIVLNPANSLAAKIIQRRLAELGFYKDGIDGVWKKHSKEALRDFKKAHDLRYIMSWDMKTQKALFQGTGQ